MKRIALWTFVLSVMFFTQEVALAKLSNAQMTSLRRKVATQKANCEKNKCEDLEILKSFDQVLKESTELRAKADLLSEENKMLRTQAEAFQKTLPKRAPSKECAKKKILKDKMSELGIKSNGDMIFNKTPIKNANATCWANSKKKKDATVRLCEFPLGINILTTGGESSRPTQKTTDYMFALNGCDLIGVNVGEETSKRKTTTSWTLPTCMETWNKRNADASMTKEQVAEMENTIQQCFKYGILPLNENQLKQIKQSGPQSISTH